MAAPVPPSTSGFTKKTWGTELIPTAELNRLEGAIESVFDLNTTFQGDKTLPDGMVIKDIIKIAEGQIIKGEIKAVGDDIIFNSLFSPADTFEFFDFAGSVYNDVKLNKINDTFIEAHRDRHGRAGTDFWARAATLVVDASGSGDYTDLTLALAEAAVLGGADIVLLPGTYAGPAFVVPDNTRIRGIGSGGGFIADDIILGNNCSIENIESGPTWRIWIDGDFSTIKECSVGNGGNILVSGKHSLVTGCILKSSSPVGGNIFIAREALRARIIGNFVEREIRITSSNLEPTTGFGHIIKGNWSQYIQAFVPLAGPTDVLSVISGNVVQGGIGGGVGIRGDANSNYLLIMGNSVEAPTPIVATGAGVIISNNAEE